MSSLAVRHFERGACGESASERGTLLAAAEEAGLDVESARSFLETDELRAEVWRSYGDTINAKGIHSIPLFCFHSEQLGLVGGPFRKGSGTPWIINGSMDAPTFLQVFEAALARLEAAPPLIGHRVVVSRLVSKPEHNGRRGLVQSFTEASGRYAVRVDGSDGLMALKPANLALAPLEAETAEEETGETATGERRGDSAAVLPQGSGAADGATTTCGEGSCCLGKSCVADAAEGEDDILMF